MVNSFRRFTRRGFHIAQEGDGSFISLLHFCSGPFLPLPYIKSPPLIIHIIMFFIMRFKQDIVPVAAGLALLAAALLMARLTAAEDMPALSTALAGCVIVVDAGHGGVDSGAIGAGGTLEKDVTLAIALQTAQLLRQSGAQVFLTREGDNDLAGADFSGTIRQRKQRDMPARVALAREVDADYFISIHTNASTSRQWRGAQVFYQSASENGRLIAEAMQAAINELDAHNTRAAAPGSYYVLTQTPMPGVLIETGFISHPDEERLLLSPEYQSRLAWAITAGLHRALTEVEKKSSQV